MQENGSPKALYDTDDPDRRHFIIELPIHPDYATTNTGGPIHTTNGGPILQTSDHQEVTQDVVGGPIGGPIMVEELTERQLEVLRIIHESDDISERRIAEILGINRSAVQKHTGSLRRKGVLERLEGTRGKWLVKYNFEDE